MANEMDRIMKTLAGLQHGECWIGIHFKEALHGVDAAMAAKKLTPETNSIWQLISHIIYWRTNVALRLSGSLDHPIFHDMLLPDRMGPEEWKQTLLDFETAYHGLKNAVHHYCKEENLDKPTVKEGQTYYELIHGNIQHDAYHLGQIIMLKKALG